MRRLTILALFTLLPVALPAGAAEPPPPPRAYETGRLGIAGEAFLTTEVADARAMPDITKKVGIMVSLTPEGAKRLAAITAALVGKPMLVTLDGKTLVAEMIRKPIMTGVIEIPGRWSLDEAEALARRISGKDPLPDELGAE